MKRILAQRSPWAALLLAVWLAVPAGAQNTTPPDTGFDEVQVDLEGQLFNQTLPFDVPFLLYGAVPQGAKTLEVDADPNAEVIYARLGFRTIGRSPSGSIPGRWLPRMALSL